ncbi:MAG: type II toxin-antitoxin system VapC family toxin [Rhodocyclaceae bacterium]|nr:type II toxin-antitoxin system VapC family toxin [Rhodocyclaceae bacterium]
MKLLLDTHILLWAAGQPEKLSDKARGLLSDTGNELVFSSASLWEIVMKHGLGRQDFRVEPGRLWRMLLAHQYRELPVTGGHALAVARLPPLHKDPFDRLLVAQARHEGMTLLTVDEQVLAYGEGIVAG